MKDIKSKDIDIYYKLARNIAGELGDDLLHQVLLNIPSTKRIDNMTTYIWRSLRNEFYNRNSQFNRLYKPHQEIRLDQDFEQIESTISNYDIFTLHTILLQLEIEGYEMEVQIFKDCRLTKSNRAIAKKTQVDVRTLEKICKFVESEIKQRYKND